jgi:hypothetical protein
LRLSASGQRSDKIEKIAAARKMAGHGIGTAPVGGYFFLIKGVAKRPRRASNLLQVIALIFIWPASAVIREPA